MIIVFIKKSIYFIFGLLLVYGMFYLFVYNHYNNKFYDDQGVFIWGDSQAYQGIDLDALSLKINKNVYSSAHHGAGVYDFLVFVDQVPEQSIVLLSLSKLVQVRRKERDFNRSGLSIWALFNLYQNNYNISEILEIAKKNFKPKRNIVDQSVLYEYSDSMEVGLTLDHFKSYYDEIPEFLQDKQNLCLKGIEKLISKKCKISFIEFPFYPELDEIEKKSPIRQKTLEYKERVSELIMNLEIEEIELDKNRNIFKDLSHLNVVGAKELSTEIGFRMSKNNKSHVFVVK